MGAVYRARDTKLKREVAIKILPGEFSRDRDRVARFQREAEVLASVNHPGIAAIYDFEEAEGARFLVMEFVEGETLAERIRRGSIAIEQALNIAKHICEALEAAHDKGITHRDLKPANIKLTPDSRVKLLDFGLAKLTETAPSPADSPMLSMTGSQVIVGTAAYMSPEQAQGQHVDRRTDIFAFGCVLYEMLTGRPAFEGKDTSCRGFCGRLSFGLSLLPAEDDLVCSAVRFQETGAFGQSVSSGRTCHRVCRNLGHCGLPVWLGRREPSTDVAGSIRQKHRYCWRS